MNKRLIFSCLAISSFTLACGDDSASSSDGGTNVDALQTASWSNQQSNLPGALMSVWGTSANDVWAVGADKPRGDGMPTGPEVWHWDGTAWTQKETGQTGDLWWVYGFADGPVYMGGTDGLILRYENDTFTKLTTPSTNAVFGIWGSSPEDMWAVGGAEGGLGQGFAWRLSGDTWQLADGFPEEVTDTRAMWKVWGSSATDVWMVGTSGVALHWDGEAFTEETLGEESIFTVHAFGNRFAAVGGIGEIYEKDGAEWEKLDTGISDALIGVCLTETGGYVVGRSAAFFEKTEGTWTVAPGPDTQEDLHAVWVDPDGGVWTAGGEVQGLLVRGVIAYFGTKFSQN